MSEAGPGEIDGLKGATAPDTPASGASERRLFENNAQPLRPGMSLRTLPRPQQPAPGPEERRVTRPHFSRTLGALKTMLPLLQRALPLLEGNVVSTLANLLAPLPQNGRVDLEPVHHALGVAHTEQLSLSAKVAEQSASLQRIGEQLDEVKDSAERNAATQRELADDLHSLRRRVAVVAWVGLALLVVSLAFNVVLFLRVQRVLP